jgi:galactoside O-acetyltransferase
MDTSFYTPAELDGMGFKRIGDDVSLSRKASVYGAGAIEIGDHVRIDDFCVLSGGSGIALGSYIHVACYCALFGGAGITMEDFSGLSARVTVYSESDDYSGRSLTNPMVPRRFRPKYHSAPVTLKRHVIVGVGSTLLPGVTLEEGVAVGAHSLVTKSCEAWSLYFGCPASKIKNRSRALLDLERQFLAEEAGAGGKEQA